MHVKTKPWTNQIDGNSTRWANLPTPMEIEYAAGEVGGDHLLVFAHFSRVQHDTRNKNTEFRLLVDGTPIAIANTGNANGWEYRDISLHGFMTVDPAAHLHIEVQYRTQGGRVLWIHDVNGPQERVLTTIKF